MALGLLALAMYISCCLCIIFRVGYAKISRRKGRFQWNMGFNFKDWKIVLPDKSKKTHDIFDTSHFINIMYNERLYIDLLSKYRYYNCLTTRLIMLETWGMDISYNT